MKIGIVSPFMPHDVADLLDAPSRALLPSIGGVTATPVTPLARAWRQMGHEIAVFCLDPSVDSERILRGDGIVIHVIPKRPNRSCLADFYRVERRLIRQSVLAEKPGVLSAQWTYEHGWAALQCGIPTVVVCHDTPLRYAWHQRHWFGVYHLPIAWRVIRGADRLICVAPYVKDHILRFFKPRCPVDVIPNGIPADFFNRGLRRLKTGAATHQLTFCTVGNWGRIKNIHTLIRAFALVRREVPAARLVLFGGELGAGQAAEQWAGKRNLKPGVVFHGSASREAILDFLEKETDVLVHPSLVEAHGLALVEAMCCAVPAIGGRQSGAVAWTLAHGQCGLLCDVTDPRDLARTMVRATREPARPLAERALASVQERFCLDNVARAQERVLQILAAGSVK